MAAQNVLICAILSKTWSLVSSSACREYKEALRNQRAQEGASVYRPRVPGELTPPSPDVAPLSLQSSPAHNGHHVCT